MDVNGFLIEVKCKLRQKHRSFDTKNVKGAFELSSWLVISYKHRPKFTSERCILFYILCTFSNGMFLTRTVK